MKIIKIVIAVLVLIFISTGLYYYFIILDDKSVKVSEYQVSENKIINTNDKNNINIEAEKELGKIDKKDEIREMVQASKTGKFIKIDSVHKATGDVTVTDVGDYYNLKFDTNFESADGPDLYVYLSSTQNFKDIAIGGVDTKVTINIGKLKNIKGIQEYKISKKDFESHDAAVVIWCKKFGVQFSRADLK